MMILILTHLQMMTPPCSVPTMNLLGMVGSKLRLLMPGGNSWFFVWADSMQYCRTGEEKFLML